MSKGKQKGKAHAEKPLQAGNPRRVSLAGLWNRLKDGQLMLVVFVIAISVRLIYLAELSEAPFFHHPVGDSEIYHNRALEIAGGDLIGREAYFHSSPLYPYFLGMIYRLFGVHFTLIRVIQFLIGSLNCVFIYLLVRKIPGGGRGTAFLAGLFAAFCGIFVFFDGDLLMIPLVLCFTMASMLLLLKASGIHTEGGIPGGGAAGPMTPEGESSTSSKKTLLYFFTSGLFLGLAGLGKPNVLLYAPFALLWIFSDFRKTFEWSRWRGGVLFTLGCCLAVFPITLRNYIVSSDFVLVSSNAGVNLYIGNNEMATGIFYLSPESGLENTHLYLSSKESAEKATGTQNMKPSQVSRYWTNEATRFMREHPGDALRLLWRKFLLFWNHYEIPNHHNFYYIRLHYGEILRRLLIGFSLVAPLALVGVVGRFRQANGSAAFRLYLGFIAVYMFSLIPFFITARYRLPAVPFLMVFSAFGLRELVDLVRSRQFKWLSIVCFTGLSVFFVTRLPLVDYDFGFTHTVMGTVYSDLATEHRDRGPEYIKKAIIEYKKALEIRPLSVDAYYNLGVAYQRIGYYSGAIKALEAVVGLKPNHPYAKKALEECRRSLETDGDRITSEAIPESPFEQALQQTNNGNLIAAEALYEMVIRKDPHHASAYSQLGAIYFDRRDFKRAVKIFKRGLRREPEHFVLNNNIAGAYYRLNEFEKARRHWEKCLEIEPNNESVQKQLRMVGR